jgi:bifunctional DNA-binding transcriptional regulator/antitoxin component of YhaV-PrlF toxin-antitoxin module
MMMTLAKRIGYRGEIVIPKRVRELAGFTTRTEVVFFPVDNGIMMIPVRKSLSELSGLFSDLKTKNSKKLDEEMFEFIGR